MTAPVIARILIGRDWMLWRRIQLFLLPWLARYRGLSDKQIKTNEAQIEWLDRISAILTAAGPRIRADASDRKAHLESVLNCCNICVSRSAVTRQSQDKPCGLQDLAHMLSWSCRPLQQKCIRPKLAHSAPKKCLLQNLVFCGKSGKTVENPVSLLWAVATFVWVLEG